ncbi:hypothetical protein [Tengunoibacter tsumagoiensis]|uniref:Baseplate protein J-like domain-containing protein n=1 Tax=Tengunoibacter tsumagoiensis TaxID=2014871 RepID=A0A402A1F9_9CHLR|nr:hypothetical protein [Tengunoibacter tsumagoiensis]GCE12954.1 hypothetical protein KTT_28130 [Tengunoibacter tsumagoiensis]
MRQGNGTELPGFGKTDPRGAKIGIIEVAPSDDRKSVLAAILTQEKLGRQQVAVVLPSQNKAFQRPQDFDDLKSLRRKLQAEIVFVIPRTSGTGPADYARQRRFQVFSSLDSFAGSIQEDERLADAEPKKGFWPFGQKARGAAGAAMAEHEFSDTPQPPIVGGAGTQPLAVIPPKTPRVSQSLPAQPMQSRWQQQTFEEDDEDLDPPARPAQLQSRRSGNFGAGAAAGAAAGLAGGALADEALRSHGAQSQPPLEIDHDDDFDQLPPPATPFEDYDEEEPTRSIQPLPQRASAGGPPPIDPEVEDDEFEEEDAPDIIQLPSNKRGRATLKLNPDQQSGAIPAAVPLEAGSLSNRGANRRGAVAGGAILGGAALGAGAAAAANRSNRGASHSNIGNPPPARGTATRGGGGRRSGRRLLLIAILLLLLTLVFGTIAYALAAPDSFQNVARSTGVANILPMVASPATVSITPDSKVVQDSYQLHAVTGTPKADQREIGLHQITFTTPEQKKDVKATGQKQTDGVRASGTLVFTNSSFTTDFTVGAGNTFKNANGVVVTLDSPVTVPHNNNPPNGPPGSASGLAHAANPGAGGNIQAGSLNGACCSVSGNIFVANPSAFVGGQDPQNYTFLQQSDINGFVKTVNDKLLSDAQAGVKAQVKSNEQLVGDIHCDTPLVKSDKVVGDPNVTDANIAVSQTCSAIAIDQAGALNMVTQLLKTKATTDLGAGYVLQGNVITQASMPDGGTKDNIPLLINAKGLWSYQFTEAQQHDLLAAIAGKSVADARTLLKARKGVADAKIDMNGSSLPTDLGQMTLSIQKVPGLSGTPTSQPTGVSTASAQGTPASQSDGSISGAKG